eukprot:3928505-Ditylum_brightwellii.AAC.1
MRSEVRGTVNFIPLRGRTTRFSVSTGTKMLVSFLLNNRNISDYKLFKWDCCSMEFPLELLVIFIMVYYESWDPLKKNPSLVCLSVQLIMHKIYDW